MRRASLFFLLWCHLKLRFCRDTSICWCRFALLRFYLVALGVMHLQAQRAISCRHAGFGQVTWRRHVSIHLEHMVRVVNCFDISQSCDRHGEDMHEASRFQTCPSARRRGCAVLCLPCLQRVSFPTLTWLDVGCLDDCNHSVHIVVDNSCKQV